MKIVFGIDSLKKGGAERVLSNLANDLINNNDVSIIVTSDITSSYPLNKKIRVFSLDNGKKSLIKNFKRVINLYKYLKEIKPDIVITFMPPQSFRVLLLKNILKLKVIVSVRNDPNREYKSLKNKITMKLLYRKSDGFVFQTDEASKYFSKKIQDRGVIIPNPINEDFLVDGYKGVRKKEIVAVGRLENQKNYFYLLDTYKELLKVKKDYKLLIYGDGSLKSDIVSYIKENKLEKNVILKGKKDNIKEEIYKSSIYILPSLYEGMPNALMEAMALGLPVIATDCPCGGPKFLIDNGKNGLLVEVNNKEELLNAILKYINEPEFALQCGNNANRDMKKKNIQQKK